MLGEDNQKMSKSRGNVVNPDEMIDTFGADAVRLYEMFMGPLEAMKPWSTRGVEGITRFLQRVWRLIMDEGRLSGAIVEAEPLPEQRRLLHQTIKKVTEDLEGLHFNTAIAQMMVFTNEMTKLEKRSRTVLEPFVLLLSPFAPHLAEELWAMMGHAKSLAYETWPSYDPALVVSEQLTIPIQVNGKLRGKIDVPAEWNQEQIVAQAQGDPKLSEWLQGKRPRKVIYVEKRLVNFVV
ncbi:MAG TPA: class I tRNA ligase family protein [Nitrospiraceae bacterium]|nr:class I tRNA ligase family protein [Nitrospiraceae bacterium]